MRRMVTEGQMVLMRGKSTMAAPRKHSKTTELERLRGCQLGGADGVLKVGCDPVGFEASDFTCAPGAERGGAQKLQRAVASPVGARVGGRVHGDFDAGDPGGTQNLCLVRRRGIAGDRTLTRRGLTRARRGGSRSCSRADAMCPGPASGSASAAAMSWSLAVSRAMVKDVRSGSVPGSVSTASTIARRSAW